MHGSSSESRSYATWRHCGCMRRAAQGGFTRRDLSVPLPVDPFTGKPFGYEQKGGTAHLRGTPPQAEKNNAGFRVHSTVFNLRN